MEAAKNRRRLIVLTIFVALGFVGLGCRLVDLQWLRHDEFARTADEQHDHIYYREAARGEIRDRHGSPLATSVPVKRVCADPFLLKGHEAELARFLAPLLKTNETILFNSFSRTRLNETGGVSAARYVVLKNQVSVDDWEKIHAALTNQFVAVTNQMARLTPGVKLKPKDVGPVRLAWTRAIYTEEDQIRTYPNAQLGAHVLGFIGDRRVSAGGITNSIVAGVEGVEAVFDEKLHGARGWVKTETTSGRQELFMFREQDVEARPGLNVVLTIDARVQQIVEEELQPMVAKHSPQGASALVVRPRTGEILAMANWPTFDPNVPGKSRDLAAHRNRVVTDIFEPGSTFKTVTMAAAFNEGIIRLTDTFDCENGLVHFAGFPLHDTHHYGVLTVREIIAESSNIGTAKVAIKMGAPRAYKYITDFGFGEKTGIALSGESRPLLPKLANWKPISISRIPIGQGVSVTPLQMTMALCAVANGGVLMRPMIVDSLVDEKGETVVKFHPQTVRRVVTEEAAKTTTEALKSVVDKKGTAVLAALEHYTVAGKTGTAQKVVDGRYSHDKFYSSFIGFFPADNPELCIYVSADEPRNGTYGGQVAAPVFRRIAERTATFLNLKPDLQPNVPGPSGDKVASEKISAPAPVLYARPAKY